MAFSGHRKDYTPPKSGRGSKLSPKMELFVERYMIHFSGPKAVEEAGYKTKNHHQMATDLLNHPLVSQKIKERKRERLERHELTADYVLMKLQSIIEDTENDNPQAALRGLELLGKHLGMYRDRQEISGPDGKAIEMEQKVSEQASDFTSKLARLAASGGAGTVAKFPKRSGEGEA